MYSIDPLDIVEANIGATEGPVALNLDFKKLKISGLHSAQMTSLRYHFRGRILSLRNCERGKGNFLSLLSTALTRRLTEW